MKTIKKISLVVLALCIALNQGIAKNCMSLEEANKKGLIKLIIKSKGGFRGDVIEMKIKNLCTSVLNFKLEAGRRLDSKNESQQDILVTKNEEFSISPKDIKTLNVYGMCCQAHNNCPTSNALYSIGKMADSNLINLARFIDSNKYYDSYTAQSAVWAISDNESIGGIRSMDKVESDQLQKYVSKITHRPIPAYSVDYDRELGGRANQIDGTFDYSLPANAHVTVAIYNINGALVQLLFENIGHQKGNYKLYYTFRTRKLQQGTYYARMNADGIMTKEMKIEF